MLAKCLSQRISGVISDLVSEDQTGFIKGRKASNLIRLIDDVINYANERNQLGILLALDYARAYDSVSKDYVVWSFKKLVLATNLLNGLKF